jgi:hypothetical protein
MKWLQKYWVFCPCLCTAGIIIFFQMLEKTFLDFCTNTAVIFCLTSQQISEARLFSNCSQTSSCTRAPKLASWSKSVLIYLYDKCTWAQELKKCLLIQICFDLSIWQVHLCSTWNKTWPQATGGCFLQHCKQQHNLSTVSTPTFVHL